MSTITFLIIIELILLSIILLLLIKVDNATTVKPNKNKNYPPQLPPPLPPQLNCNTKPTLHSHSNINMSNLIMHNHKRKWMLTYPDGSNLYFDTRQDARQFRKLYNIHASITKNKPLTH